LFEKVTLLFERMELSQGWKDLSKKMGRTNSSLSLQTSKGEQVSQNMSQFSHK